jgi:hypothetical protein
MAIGQAGRTSWRTICACGRSGGWQHGVQNKSQGLRNTTEYLYYLVMFASGPPGVARAGLRQSASAFV